MKPIALTVLLFATLGCSSPEEPRPTDPPHLTSPSEIADRIRSILRIAKHSQRFEKDVAPHAGSNGKSPSWRGMVAGMVQIPVVVGTEGVPEFDKKWEKELEGWYTLGREWNSLPDSQCKARVQAVVGPGTFFERVAAGDRTVPPLRGVSSDHLLADAILVVEVDEKDAFWLDNHDFDVPAEEEDLDESLLRKLGTGRSQFAVGFADGTVWTLARSIPPSTLKKFFYVDSAKISDRDEVLGPYRIDSLSPFNEKLLATPTLE